MTRHYVIVEKKDGIAKLTLNRPEKLNAIIGGMREEILSAIEELSTDNDVRVVVLTGAGRAFCAGGDINYLAELMEKKDYEGFRTLLEIGRKAVTILHTMPKPAIAAVNGPAAGAGLNLAVACDIRIASEKASFGASFAKIGLHPDWGGSWFLPRLLGPSKACELVFSGEMIDAREAKEIGLANQVYPHEEFETRVAEFAKLIASRSPRIVGLAKKLLWQAHEWEFEKTLEREKENQLASFQSHDAREGIHAFLEKRQPVFTGK